MTLWFWYIIHEPVYYFYRFMTWISFTVTSDLNIICILIWPWKYNLFLAIYNRSSAVKSVSLKTTFSIWLFAIDFLLGLGSWQQQLFTRTCGIQLLKDISDILALWMLRIHESYRLDMEISINIVILVNER